QLAERLADLFDQYQVYRADWLKDWAAGEHILNTARGERKALPPGNRWQAELWRALLDDVGEAGMAQSRAGVHQRFIERINSLQQAPAG
ncbi:exodeoxyribonuclease V subunit gamma, partial [Pseudoalteromonas sp. SIMBA_153]